MTYSNMFSKPQCAENNVNNQRKTLGSIIPNPFPCSGALKQRNQLVITDNPSKQQGQTFRIFIGFAGDQGQKKTGESYWSLFASFYGIFCFKFPSFTIMCPYRSSAVAPIVVAYSFAQPSLSKVRATYLSRDHIPTQSVLIITCFPLLKA
jgi:hypothetical protein